MMILLMLMMNVSLFSQSLGKGFSEAEKRQRRLEMAAFTAVFFAAGCGNDLLARQEGSMEIENNYRKMGIARDLHRIVHGVSASTGISLYLISGWKLYRINENRGTLEFRHKAHNALFATTVAGLTTAGILGVLSGKAFRSSNSEKGGDYARIMQRVSFFALTTGFADIVLFGGRDNATLWGVKIRL